MYIETRTTVQEVLDQALKELDYKCNSVNNGVWTREKHPTYTTKGRVRDELEQLNREGTKGLHGIPEHRTRTSPSISRSFPTAHSGRHGASSGA